MDITGMPRSVGLPTDENGFGMPGPKSSEKSVVKQFLSDYKLSNGAFEKRRQEWKRYIRAYNGQPFDEVVVAGLAKTERVLSNFNFSLSTINALLGQEMADRKEGHFMGIDKSQADAYAGELFTDLVRHLFLRAHGHRKLSRVQLDQLLTGYGWGEVYMDTTKFPFEINLRHVDVFKMYVDPRYQADNCSDARFVIEKSKWYVDDVLARWPKKAKDLRGLISKSSGGDNPAIRRSTGDYMGYAKGPSDTNFRAREDKDRIEVSCYQFKVLEPWVAFAHPQDGRELQLSREEYDKLVSKLSTVPNEETGGVASDGMKGVDFQREVVYSCWIAGLDEENCVVLDEPKIVEGGMFSYRCATAYAGYDAEKGLHFHFGLMALVYEPQLWITKSFSAMIDYIAQQRKGGGFIKKSALVNPAGFQTDVNKPGAWIMAVDEADLDKDIKPNPPMNFPAVYERILEFAINAIPRLTNVTDAVKGTMTSERSNVLISNLQQHSQMVLNPLLDPISQFQVDVSRLIARFAQAYLPASAINRILGERECEGVTFNNVPDPMTGQLIKQPVTIPDPSVPVDPETGEGGQRPVMPSDTVKAADLLDYDIEVDLGAASATSKQAFTGAMMQTAFFKALQDGGMLSRFMPLIIRNWPGMPASEGKKLADEFEADAQAERAMRNGQAIMQAISAMPPDQQMALVAQVQQMIIQQGVSPQAGGQPVEQSPPQ